MKIAKQIWKAKSFGTKQYIINEIRNSVNRLNHRLGISEERIGDQEINQEHNQIITGSGGKLGETQNRTRRSNIKNGDKRDLKIFPAFMKDVNPRDNIQYGE